MIHISNIGGRVAILRGNHKEKCSLRCANHYISLRQDERHGRGRTSYIYFFYRKIANILIANILIIFADIRCGLTTEFVKH